MMRMTPRKVIVLVGSLLALLSFGGGPSCANGDCLSAGTDEYGPTSCDQVECCNANATCLLVPKHTDEYGLEIGTHVTCPAPNNVQAGVTEP